MGTRPYTGNTYKQIGAAKHGRIRNEHSVIAERALGRALPAGVEVHHVDGLRSNNATTNLVICPDRAYHMMLHARQRAQEACGNADWKRCTYCKQYDDPSTMLGRSSGKQFYHRACRPSRAAI